MNDLKTSQDSQDLGLNPVRRRRSMLKLMSTAKAMRRAFKTMRTT
jgi:hypothetical protein